MLTVGPNLSSYTLGAGEPFLLQVAFQKADGTPSARTGRTFVLAFFKADRTQVAKIDGELSADSTFIRFEEDGSLSDQLYGQSVSVELAERLRNGRDDIAIGTLVVKPTANDIASLDNASVGNVAIRAVVKEGAALGDKPTITTSVVAYVSPGGTPAPVLGTLTLSGPLQIGVATSGTITGATAGSAIADNIPGITVVSDDRTYSGTPTGSAGTIANGLVETKAGADGSPKASPITVAAASGSGSGSGWNDNATWSDAA